MCGEYEKVGVAKVRRIGSPPRVWGIPSLNSLSKALNGITPTCVGNTTNRWTNHHAWQGSPPRVWGIRWCLYFTQESVGITPTCVGNTVTKNDPR